MPDFLEPPVVRRSGAPPRARCGRYSGGHTPHYIQVRLCWQSPEEDWERVVVMDVRGDVVVLARGEELTSYRNHETAYLSWVVSQVGAEAEFNTDYKVLFMRPWPDGARSVFSLQSAERVPEECRPGD